MTPIDDPHLAELFAEEIKERAERLVRHTRAWRGGDWRDDTAEEAQRDAHTIKGNAAFVGDSGLSAAAGLLEMVWGQVRSGSRVFSQEAADAMIRAAGALSSIASGAGRDPVALDPISEMLGVPNPFEVYARVGEEETFYALARDLPDLGGLLSTEAPHFLDEVSPIDSARFGRLVDSIAEQRLDTEALITALHDAFELRNEGDWRAATDNLISSVRSLFQEATELGASQASQITSTLDQLVRYIARRSGKAVDLEIVGGVTEADRFILDSLREPIRHLVVNSVEHGIETQAQRVAAGKPRKGRVVVRFRAEDDVLVVDVDDDGRGVDWLRVRDAMEMKGIPTEDLDEERMVDALFATEFSTMMSPTQFSGDGSGLAIVGRSARALGGAVLVGSRPSAGTVVTLRVPRLRAMQQVEVVHSGGQRWGIPSAVVTDVVEIHPGEVHRSGAGETFAYRDVELRYAPIRTVLGGIDDDGGDPLETHALIIGTTGSPFALGVAAEPERAVAVTKQLGPSLAGVDLLSGAALLGGGDFVAVLDATSVGRAIRSQQRGERSQGQVLVVDDSRAARQLLTASLTSAGFRVVSFARGLELLHRPEVWGADLIITDLQMPGYTGFDLIKDLRARGVVTPIAVLSGVAGEADFARALRVGADLIFEKADLRKGAFVEAVREIVKKRSGSPKPMKSPPPTERS